MRIHRAKHSSANKYWHINNMDKILGNQQYHEIDPGNKAAFMLSVQSPTVPLHPFPFFVSLQPNVRQLNPKK